MNCSYIGNALIGLHFKVFDVFTAYQTFPELFGKEIEFQDLEGAIMRPLFFPTFLSFSPIGVIIKIVLTNSSHTLHELELG